MIKRDVDISVIIVVYNQQQSLQLALQALLAQDFCGSYEIIITDDGSSSELFHSCREEFNNSPVPIKYVWQQDHNFRATSARNNGIKISKGRYLLFLDGDIIPALDTLRKHVDAHTRSKLLIAGNRKWRGELINNLRHLMGGKSIGEVINFLDNNYAVTDEKSQQRELTEQEWRKHCISSIHPWQNCYSCHLSVEWASDIFFDENFVGWGPEDWEFSYRLCVRQGYTPIYRDDIIAYHLETPGAMGNIFRTGTHKEIVMYMKNTFYFFEKCSGLTLDEVFFSFPRFTLDVATNMWSVIPRPDPSSYDLGKVVRKIKQWLLQNESS